MRAHVRYCRKVPENDCKTIFDVCAQHRVGREGGIRIIVCKFEEASIERASQVVIMGSSCTDDSTIISFFSSDLPDTSGCGVKAVVRPRRRKFGLPLTTAWATTCGITDNVKRIGWLSPSPDRLFNIAVPRVFGNRLYSFVQTI